jgi:HEAT repeat protein
MTRMAHGLCLALVCAAAVVAPLHAADDAAKARERTREVILYGIDSEVLDVVLKMKATGDASFASELAGVLSEQRGVDLRKAVFELFSDTKAPEGEKAAAEILKGWEEAPGELVIAAIRYLSAIEAKGRTALFSPLVDAPQAAAASAAIRGLGKTADPAAADLLLKKLASPEVPEASRGDLIVALGELKDPRAVQPLLAIARNKDEDKSRRMYAADALGRIGDPSALPVLRDIFGEKDALLKAYAVAALSRFAVEEAFPLLVTGLKDENWKVRVECAKALARPLDPARSEQALSILFYKAQSDPTVQVKVEAVRAIGAIGGEKAAGFLAGLYRDSRNPLAVREESLTIVARTSPAAVQEAVHAVIAEEWKAVDQRTARIVSAIDGSQLQDNLARFLDSPNPIVRIYGVRAIAAHGLKSLRDRVAALAEKDPHPGVQREAARALEKL